MYETLNPPSPLIILVPDTLNLVLSRPIWDRVQNTDRFNDWKRLGVKGVDILPDGERVKRSPNNTPK